MFADQINELWGRFCLDTRAPAAAVWGEDFTAPASICVEGGFIKLACGGAEKTSCNVKNFIGAEGAAADEPPAWRSIDSFRERTLQRNIRWNEPGAAVFEQ